MTLFVLVCEERNRFYHKKKKTAPKKDQQHNKSANKIKRNDKNSLNSVCE